MHAHSTIDQDILYNQGTLIKYLNKMLNEKKAVVDHKVISLSEQQLDYLNSLKKQITTAQDGAKFGEVYIKWRGKNSPQYLFTANSPLKDSDFMMLLGLIREHFVGVPLYPELFFETIPRLFNSDYIINTDNAIKIFDLANKMALTFSVAEADNVTRVLSDIFGSIFSQLDLTNSNVYDSIHKQVIQWDVQLEDEYEKKMFEKQVTDYMNIVKEFLKVEKHMDSEKIKEKKAHWSKVIGHYLDTFKQEYNDPLIERFYPAPKPSDDIKKYLGGLESDLHDLRKNPIYIKQCKCAQIQQFLAYSLAQFRELQRRDQNIATIDSPSQVKLARVNR